MPIKKGELPPHNCESKPRDNVFSKKEQTFHFKTNFSVTSKNLRQYKKTALRQGTWFRTETITDKLMRTVGLPLARKNSNIAVSWGNLSASEWAEDRTYARYLTLNTTNGGG